jgi:hypothetical protein
MLQGMCSKVIQVGDKDFHSQASKRWGPEIWTHEFKLNQRLFCLVKSLLINLGGMTGWENHLTK